MANHENNNRPLSPHLSIYRPQMTSISSIFVRITGNALFVSALLCVWWFLAAATGEKSFSLAQYVLTSWIGSTVLLLSLWALWYHLLGGLRHLIWDAGFALEVATAEKLGWAMFVGAFVLSALTLWII